MRSVVKGAASIVRFSVSMPAGAARAAGPVGARGARPPPAGRVPRRRRASGGAARAAGADVVGRLRKQSIPPSDAQAPHSPASVKSAAIWPEVTPSSNEAISLGTRTCGGGVPESFGG